ncbi:hypothetical protein K2173_008407 [Erythroxylum novogranatense]|uniref:Gag-pol polyprotein n=1 Tax=Erythroxylum novogranatense TaxID=1862640 RepID=A0AAV8UA40_9ROSI|nr:hypothetical protein K2173_008407 [Erythroxylum novogranatense]
MVLSWIPGSLSKSVLSQVVSTTTAHAAWSRLQTTFTSGSRAQIRTLKNSLHSLSRENDSIVTYIDRAKRIFDQLAALDAAISEDDLIDHILRGLGPDYRPFTRNIEAKLVSISFDDLFGLLLSGELQLQNAREAITPLTVAHFAGRQSTNGGQRRRGRGSCRAGSSSYSGPAHYSASPNNQTKPWIVDTGATHHLTSELENLGIHSEYSGTDEVTLTIGKQIPISHVGSNSITLSARPFSLRNILHFTSSNDVSIEFFSNRFVIKVRQTQEPLHQGYIKDSLYYLASDPVSLACHSISLST